jgi:hypothetical protein
VTDCMRRMQTVGSVPKDIPAFRMEENNAADTSVRSVSVVATFERGTGKLGVRYIAVMGWSTGS